MPHRKHYRKNYTHTEQEIPNKKHRSTVKVILGSSVAMESSKVEVFAENAKKEHRLEERRGIKGRTTNAETMQ